MPQLERENLNATAKRVPQRRDHQLQLRPDAAKKERKKGRKEERRKERRKERKKVKSKAKKI